MSNLSQVAQAISAGEYDGAFAALYGKDGVSSARERYCKCAREFIALYGDLGGAKLVSAPGRTEVCGNHTDHNNGLVAAAAVNLDIIGVIAPNRTNTVKIKSKGFQEDCVELGTLTPLSHEKGSSAAIIRGIASRIAELGHEIGGFSAYTVSDVLKGSGLSSSAAFEVAVAQFFNCLFCGGELDAVSLAQIGQYSENVFYGKPCGLLDEATCASGGFVFLDFEDTDAPKVSKFPLSLEKMGLALCVVDTGGSHADLTADYSAMPYEMKSVAAFLGKTVLREVTEQQVWDNSAGIRRSCGDRAFLRAVHYFGENKRVSMLMDAVKNADADAFHAIVRASGLSSFMFNQNAFAVGTPREQGLSVGYAMCGRLLGEKGSYRLQGGGFAGTIQAFVPVDMLYGFKKGSEAVFGEGSCHILSIREYGAIDLDTIK